MFRHVVCFRLKDTDKNKADEAKEKLLSLTCIPEVKKIEAGCDEIKNPRSYDIVLIVDFDSKADYEIYDTHELHQPVRAYMQSIMDAAVAVDYHVDNV